MHRGLSGVDPVARVPPRLPLDAGARLRVIRVLIIRNVDLVAYRFPLRLVHLLLQAHRWRMVQQTSLRCVHLLVWRAVVGEVDRLEDGAWLRAHCDLVSAEVLLVCE